MHALEQLGRLRVSDTLLVRLHHGAALRCICTGAGSWDASGSVG